MRADKRGFIDDRLPAVGLDVLTQSGFTLRLTFSQSESDHTETKMGSLKMSGRFEESVYVAPALAGPQKK